jgi:putative tricarboxylic transport membrane protein
METAIYNVMQGFSVACLPMNLLYCFTGVFLGTIIGVMPGIGPSGTIVILLPITFYLDPTGAIMLLAGIYYGSQYGGSTTSILLNIPGEATSIMTCLDGYQMHKKGRGGAALGISAFGSFFAGTMGIIGVTLLAPVLVEWALKFGPPEYFGLTMLVLTLVGYLARGSALKGLMMTILGVLLASVGYDPMQNLIRYTFGSMYLIDGMHIIILAMGLFAVREIFNLMVQKPGAEIVKPPEKLRELLPNRQEWRDSAIPVVRGSFTGFLVGLLPGAGGVLATVVSYGVEKRFAKHPERFGTGEIAGVAGPESANNGSAAGAFIPLLTLGIPGSVPTAMLIGALMLHGITPGPMFMETRPEVFWGLIASMYIGNVMLLVLNLPLIRVFTKIAYVPFRILTPVIMCVTLTAVFLVNNNPYDILVMLIFGLFGFIVYKHGLEVAPLIFGFILGPMVEISLRRSLILSRGDFGIFVSSPISATLLGIAFLVWISPIFRKIWKVRRQSRRRET